MEYLGRQLLIGLIVSAYPLAGGFYPTQSGSIVSAQKRPAPPIPSFHRDWQIHPAVVQFDTKQDLYVVGDAHADYDRLTAVLVGAHLIGTKPAQPKEVVWSAGSSILVFTGDYIDKGDAGLKVISLLRVLQTEATAAGGKVVLLMGNHEAEFLGSAKEDKVSEFAGELRAAGLSPDSVAGCNGDLGQFLCNLPFAARVNDWFLSHAGNTNGRTLSDLSRDLQLGVDRDGFGSSQLRADDSILEARLGNSPWFEIAGADDESTLKKYATTLGVSHIVQGHQPGKVEFSDGEKRKAGEMYQRYGVIFLEDTGMSRGVGHSFGSVLHISTGKLSSATAICPDGSTTTLWDSVILQKTGRAKPCLD